MSVIGQLIIESIESIPCRCCDCGCSKWFIVFQGGSRMQVKEPVARQVMGKMRGNQDGIDPYFKNYPRIQLAWADVSVDGVK